MHIRAPSRGRLRCQAANDVLGRASLVVDLLQVGEHLHEEERGDVGEVEVVEPYGLVQAQRLQGRLVEDRDRSNAHGWFSVFPAGVYRACEATGHSPSTTVFPTVGS